MRRLFVLLPVVAVLMAYLPVLSAALVWDDHTLLQASVLQAPWEPLPFNPDYFRPLGVVSLQLGEAAANPLPAHHRMNLLLHALNTALVFALIRQRTPASRDWAPLLLSLLYGLHPALIEGIAFVSSRFDLLLTSGLLLALVLDRSLKGAAGTLTVGLAFGLAALSKEMALTFPLVLLLWQRAEHSSFRETLRACWPSHAVLGLTGLGYLGLRYQALDGLLSAERAMLAVGDPVSHVLLIARSIASYLGLLVMPMGQLSPIHHAELPLTADAVGLLTLAGVLAGFAVLLRAGPLGWRLLATLAALLPVVNILPLDLTGGAFIAERFLVFPAGLFVVGLSLWIAPRLSWRRAPLGIIALVFWLGSGLATIRDTLPHWQNEESLWQWGIIASPRSPLPRINLARLRTDAGDPRSGLLLAEEAIALDPGAVLGWNNKGQALFHLGELKEAARCFETAGQLAPESAMFHANLGATLLELGELEAARTVLTERALFWDADHVEARITLVGVYLRSGRPDLARPVIDRLAGTLPVARIDAMRADTMNHEDWLALGDQLRATGNLEEAHAALTEAARLGAAPVDLAVSRSSVLIEAGQLSDAVRMLAEFLPGTDARIPFNLGIIAERAGQPGEAARWFTEAASRDPSWSLPLQKRAELPLSPGHTQR